MFHTTLARSLGIIGITAILAAPLIWAQDVPLVRVRGAIERVEGPIYVIKARDGAELKLTVADKASIATLVKASLADIKQGFFVGVTSMPQADGSLSALEVHIFPEAMRGTGEGFRAFDLAPKSSMTNGNISARVDAATGPKLTVTYKGGEQTIVVDPKTPIVAFEPGAQAELKPGAAIIARGPKKDDGSIDAAFVLVGKDGLVPPM